MIERAANTATYGGSVGAVFFGLNANEFAAMGGLLVGVIGLAVNIWFKWQNRRDFKRKLDMLDD